MPMVPRLRRGRLAGRALSHPFILRGQKSKQIGACGGLGDPISPPHGYPLGPPRPPRGFFVGLPTHPRAQSPQSSLQRSRYTWFKVTSLNTKSPARSGMSVPTLRSAGPPRMTSSEHFLTMKSLHAPRPTQESRRPIPLRFPVSGTRVAQTRVHWRRTELATPSNDTPPRIVPIRRGARVRRRAACSCRPEGVR